MFTSEYNVTRIWGVPDVGNVDVALPEAQVKLELAHALALAEAGYRVAAIKHLRRTFDTGLREAHRMVTAMAGGRLPEEDSIEQARRLG